MNAKRSSWREFCTKADSAKSVSNLVKMLQADKVYKVSLLKVGDRVSSTPAEALGMLLDVAFVDHVGLEEEGPQAGGAALRPRVMRFGPEECSVTAEREMESLRAFSHI